MGIRERLQMVTQFFQKAATKGHQLRQADARDESQPPSGGAQGRQREEPPSAMTAEDRDQERPAQSGAARTPAET